jgi:uncharacterized UBP type Zn finger protein
VTAPQHVLQGSQRMKKTYSITSLPSYLIFHVKRFTRNNFFVEKNPTIVNFPIKNLELRDYVTFDTEMPSEDELKAKYVKPHNDISHWWFNWIIYLTVTRPMQICLRVTKVASEA